MKILNILSILTLISLLGCEKGGSYDYEFFVNDTYFEITAGLNTIETHVFVIQNVNTFLSAQLSNNGSNLSEVKNIAAGRATLSGKYENLDMGFLKQVRIRLVKKDNPKQYQEIFRRDNIPISGEFQLALNPTLADIKDYIDDEQINIEIRIQLRRTTPAFIPMEFDFSYAVIK